MKRLFLCAVLFACALPLAAQVSDSVWNALIGREVLITKLDGSEVRGELIGVDETSVTVARADGRIVSVVKADAEEVRTTTATPVAPAPEETPADPAVDAVRSDIPLGSTYFLFDPLGFLQLGPIVEYGFLVGSSTYVAPRLRIIGLGVLSQATSGWVMRPYSTAIGVNTTGMFGGSAPNRFYGGGSVEFGMTWNSGVDYYGAWEGDAGLIMVFGSFGHRWRYVGGFGFSLGAFGGVGSMLWDEWSYTHSPQIVYAYDDPALYFAGGLQLALTWE